MDVNQVYQLMLYTCTKNLQEGYLSPDDFYHTINAAQRSYLDYLLGEYQKYQIQRPIAVVSFGENQRIRQSIVPLVYGAILNPDSVTGIAPFPNDYESQDAMWSVYGYYNIRFAQQDSLDSTYHSTIDPIQKNPIYLIQHEGFHFFPENIGMARLSYIRTPPSIVWGYVEDSNGIPVYDPSQSQDPVWAETDMLEIIVRALSLVGVNLQVGALLQYSNDIKSAGQ